MDAIEKLKNIFCRFPTVGQRTASRFVFYLLKLPKERVDEIISAILELKNRIKLCQLCFNPYEENGGSPASAGLFPVCRDSQRNKQILCIIEKEADLLTIEGTKKYSGLYFILSGSGSLRIEQLKNRIKSGNFSEIIVALNSTPEGRANSALIEKEIYGLQFPGKITHLAQGIPFGGELEYADEETLESAFLGRK